LSQAAAKPSDLGDLLYSDYLVESINNFPQLFWLNYTELVTNSLHGQSPYLADFYP
jgi:hypothetical protein